MPNFNVPDPIIIPSYHYFIQSCHVKVISYQWVALFCDRPQNYNSISHRWCLTLASPQWCATCSLPAAPHQSQTHHWCCHWFTFKPIRHRWTTFPFFIYLFLFPVTLHIWIFPLHSLAIYNSDVTKHPFQIQPICWPTRSLWKDMQMLNMSWTAATLYNQVTDNSVW